MAFLAICPRCGTRVAVTSASTAPIRCSKCGERFVPRPSGQAASSAGEVPHPAASDRDAAKTIPDVMRPPPGPGGAGATQSEQTEPQATQAADTHTEQDVPRPVEATMVDGPSIAQPPAEEAVAVAAAEADVPLEWQVGDIILDTYEVKDIHHGGGMGLVYRVHHRNWNMDLAVKSPRVDFFKTEKQKEEFVGECETWINLGLHPNIVSCYYVRTLGGVPRVFAEYVEGGSLKDWIESSKLYEGGHEEALRRILDIAIQFAWGLHYAHQHEQRLIHRDVKPDNVMMTPEGTPKVTDFGLAKARAALGESPSGGAGQGVAVSRGGMTPAYCSPEQANKEPLTIKTDIWSWAVSVLEMFTGTHPQEGPGAPDLLESCLKAGPEDESLPEIPEAVANLLRHCFQRNPDERPKDMAEVAARLKEVYREATGQEYVREEPKAAEMLADSLNNRAVSMLDLGRKEEAEKVFDQTLQADPHHPEGTYNRGLLLWRCGRMTDDELVRRLQEVRASHPDESRDEYLLALVHLERADLDAAAALLNTASKVGAKDGAVQAALKGLSVRGGNHGRCAWHVRAHRLWVNAVALSPNGTLAVSGSMDFTSRDRHDYTTLKLWDLRTEKELHAFGGYTDHIGALAFSPDGRFVLSAGRTGGVRLWDVASGRLVRSIITPATPYAVAFAPGGQIVLLAAGNVVLIRSLPTNALLGQLNGHTAEVSSVVTSRDGRVILTGSADRTLRVWKAETRQAYRVLDGHADIVRSVAISSDGTRAVSGSYDGTVRVWDIQAGACVAVLQGHTGKVHSVATRADGKLALSAGEDHTVRVWDLDEGRCLRTFSGHENQVLSVAIATDGSMAFSGGWDSICRLWTLARGERQPFVLSRPKTHGELTGVASQVRSLKQLAQKQLARGDAAAAGASLKKAFGIGGYERDDELVAMWGGLRRLARPTALRDAWEARTLEHHTREVTCLAFSQDGRFVLTGGRDGRACLLRTADNQCEKVLSAGTTWITSVAIAGDGSSALLGSAHGALLAWRSGTDELLHLPNGHKEYITSVTMSPEGHLALSGSEDGTARLWMFPSGCCVRTLEGHRGTVNSVSVSPDGLYALSGAEDKTIRVWRLVDGWCGKVLDAQAPPALPRTSEERCMFLNHVVAKHVSRTGGSGGGYGEMMLKSRDLNLRRTELGIVGKARGLDFHSGEVLCLAVSPDGRLLAAGTDEAVVRVWDCRTGQCMQVLSGHSGRVAAVAFSPDGRFLLSGSWDKSVCIWDIMTGRCVRALQGHSDIVTAVAFAPDGLSAMSCSHDRSVRVWRLVWEYEFPAICRFDESISAHFEIFLNRCSPLSPDGIRRIGRPTWTEKAVDTLMVDLQRGGYGWLRREDVLRKLGEMTANWNGSPLSPWDMPLGSPPSPNGREMGAENPTVAVTGASANPAEPLVTTRGAAQTQSTQLPQATSGDLNCPKCSSDQYKPFLLRGKTVHKCIACGHQDYVSSSGPAIEPERTDPADAATLFAPANGAPSQGNAQAPVPAGSSGQAGIDWDLLRRIIREAGNERLVLQRVLFGWGVGHGSPEARHIYENYVKALPRGASPPDIREFVKELLRMVDPVAMRLRDEKPEGRTGQAAAGGQPSALLKRIADLSATRQELLARIQGRTEIDKDRVQKIAREIMADQALVRKMMATGDFKNAMAEEIQRRYEQETDMKSGPGATQDARQSGPGGEGQSDRKVCSCGAASPSANTFCVACGKRLPEAGIRTCTYCKGPVTADQAFCVHCGKRLLPPNGA